MNTSPVFLASTPNVETNSIIEQLREDSAAPLLLSTACVGAVLILFGDLIYQSSWQGSVVGLFLMCVAFFAIWARRTNITCSIWLMISGWAASIVAPSVWQPHKPVVILYCLPILAGILLLGWKSGLGIALVITGVPGLNK